jgi:Protein of unknown function (DUF1553)/Protein of unknown function (DUF1549)/Planctomycete cytochrome C
VRQIRLGLILLLGTCSGSRSWGHEATAFARADLDFFEAKVRPVLVNRCFSCHASDAKKVRGGLLLDSRSGVLAGGDIGPAAVAGKPEESRIVEAVRYKNPDLSMPPAGKLPDHESAILIEWIRRGLPYPTSTEKKVARTAINLEEGRKFWSFQPVKPLPAPALKNQAWVQKPIDAFIRAELENNGLEPSAAASKRVLIRRVYFDVVGLPPAPEEVEAFAKDSSADAYARLVDRLLLSPHHGERWGRYWLDLARYCDIPEPWAETKGTPYLYRDWVVRALNQDMPYDQFIIKQLAADLLPGAPPEDMAALGFLGLSPSYWKELKLAPEVIRTVVAEEWEERIHAVSSTFLGLTVACARCHDHKFDPTTTADYYGLAGVFASTRAADRFLLPPAQAQLVRKAHQQLNELNSQVAKLKDMKSPESLKKVAELQSKIEAVTKQTPHFDAPVAPAVEEASLLVLPDGPHKTKLTYKPGEAQDVALQVRGNAANPGKVVPRRFLSVLSGDSPRVFTRGSGRLELAQTIVADAAPLAARVMVNRVWKHHFGRGIVETPSDFASQGDRPTHPELLDDLAARFIANGWSLRWLHREILLSATYQQASTQVKDKQALDPENRLLWRMNRRRLDIEAWRDALLCVTDTLERKIGGPPMDLGDPRNLRRTLYGTIKRRELHDLLRLHDFPDPTAHSSHRVPTVTPLQQLFILNSPLMQQQSVALAARLKKEGPDRVDLRLERMHRLVYGRPATEKQIRLGREYLRADTKDVWQEYAQVLLGSNEFLFVD